MSLDDLVEIVDMKDNPTRETITRRQAHEQSLPHRIAAVFVFSEDDKLFVQVRRDNGRFDHTVGGHVDVGESYEQAAVREMQEEVGIDAPLTLVAKSIIEDCREAGYGSAVHLHGLFKTIAPKDWKFTPNDEVSELRLMSLQEITSDMKADPNQYTYGFVKTLGAYLESMV